MRLNLPTSFIVKGQGDLTTSDSYTVNRKLLKSISNTYPESSRFITNVQNTYKQGNDFLLHLLLYQHIIHNPLTFLIKLFTLMENLLVVVHGKLQLLKIMVSIQEMLFGILQKR